MLKTVDEVLDALGDDKVATLVGGDIKSSRRIWNWRDRRRFPSEIFLIFSEALAERGLTADPELFGIKPPEAAEARQ